MAANTRFSVGVHALVLLALEPAAVRTSETIAGTLGTNPVIIRRVFSLLQQAGLIVSHKGPSGGSQLAKPAKEITLRDIYKALEPSSVLHEAAVNGSGTDLVTREIARAFKSAEASMLASLSETTLHSIAKRSSKKSR